MRVRRALSGNGNFCFASPGDSCVSEKAVHGEVTLVQMIGREREKKKWGRTETCACKKR